MIKSFFSITITILLSSNLFAQDIARQNLTSEGLIYAFDMNDNTVVGTPYIIDEFMPGKIIFEEESTIFGLRYNAFHDVIEVQKDNGELDTLNKDLTGVTVVFVKDNKTYRVFSYQDPKTNESKNGYFVVASEGSKPLLIKEIIVFTEKQKAKSSYDKSKPPQYKRQNDMYYTLNDEGIAVELPRNKKSLANTFPKHSKKVLAFIKSNKIKTTNQEDLMKLLNYIETL